MTRHRVAIVVDTAFGERVLDLAARLHVWIVDTPANRAVAARVWASGEEYATTRGVTTFVADVAESPEQHVIDVLPVVEIHHGADAHDPPCAEIEVLGAAPTPAVRAAFAEFDYNAISERPAGFVAVKSET